MSNKVTVLVSEGSRRDAHALNDLLLRWRARHEEVASYALDIELNDPATLLTMTQIRKLIKYADYDSLIDLKQGIEELIEPVKRKLTAIRRKYHDGYHTSLHEHEALKARKSYLGARHQTVVNELAKRNRARKSMADTLSEAEEAGQLKSYDEIFRQVAQVCLDQEMLNQIHQRASSLRRQQERKLIETNGQKWTYCRADI